jgi:predicted RNA-binding Zn-ribbon protein involved in translation (DUF1610 family)
MQTQAMTTITLCSACGKPISEERLSAVPSATRCLDCQAEAEGQPLRRIDHDCPRCGHALTWRCRQRGTADYFIGCTAFPDCRYTE